MFEKQVKEAAELHTNLMKDTATQKNRAEFSRPDGATPIEMIVSHELNLMQARLSNDLDRLREFDRRLDAANAEEAMRFVDRLFKELKKLL